VAICQAIPDQATALGKSSGGIRLGIMARWAGVEMARTTPKAKATDRIPPTETRSSTTIATNAEAATASARIARKRTNLRSKRSAIWPLTSARQKAGRNSIKPTSPRSKGLPVR
jgi:hypothetical protein